MKRPKSDIPENTTERVIQEFRQEVHPQGKTVYFRVAECVLASQVVGYRAYDEDGRLMRETPIKNGKKHGREYIWDFEGALESVEPYVEGQLHGLAKQYDRNGKVIGTYRFVRGTGYDIWRYRRTDGTIGISEIHSIQNSAMHGFEWWVRSDQQSVWHERHWLQGKYHGIERIWNKEGRLKRGYPKYWIHNRAVSKREYMKAAEKDETLPKYRETDDLPQRQFPVEIEIPQSK